MSRTLFIAQGISAQAWYRCALPAISLDNADWIGANYTDTPTHENFGYLVGGSLEKYPDPKDYEVIVVQQPRGEEWRKLIEYWQSEGIKVIYECDDFIHGIWKIDDHNYKDYFHKKRNKEFEKCMKQCDAMISSTDFLSNQYKKYNENQHVCLVSLDTKRYNIEFAPKTHITIGWAGGTGHHKAVGPWLEVVNGVMKRNPDIGFCSIGVNYASALEPYHPGRTLSIPWVPIESYPYALTNIDIMICPSHESKYFKSKSDLRWLEASALGIPTISNPITYTNDEALTITAPTPKDFELELEDCLYDEGYTSHIAASANEYVKKNRDINKGKDQWAKVIETVKG